MKTEKIAQCDTTSDALNLLRAVAECKKKKTQMQQKRAHMLVDRLDVDDRDVRALSALSGRLLSLLTDNYSLIYTHSLTY